MTIQQLGVGAVHAEHLQPERYQPNSAMTFDAEIVSLTAPTPSRPNLPGPEQRAAAGPRPGPCQLPAAICNPDNQIDFGTGTLDAVRGRIIFPLPVEPFGQRIIDIYQASNLPQEIIEENIERYAFPELYTNTQQNARQIGPATTCTWSPGSARASVQDSYNLGFALVEGSVTGNALTGWS
jgi:hypothetical protein